MPWLDAARYADSNGYQRDGHRTIWPYRDWVIRALNADMPFDQFTIEQIAGDLLPDATLDQQIATGFHRCTTVNVEAGTDEEENRTNQVIDRVNVTGTVWLGTTLECCQCHDHKYDPFTQRDYYRAVRLLQQHAEGNVPADEGLGLARFWRPGSRVAARSEQGQRRAELASRQQQIAAELEQCLEDEASGLAAWEREMHGRRKQTPPKLPANIRKLLAVASAKRNKNQQNAAPQLLHHAASRSQADAGRNGRAAKELAELAPVKSLVMTESEPRMTAILDRGNFLVAGQAVEPGTPRVLPPAGRSATPRGSAWPSGWSIGPIR